MKMISHVKRYLIIGLVGIFTLTGCQIQASNDTESNQSGGQEIQDSHSVSDETISNDQSSANDTSEPSNQEASLYQEQVYYSEDNQALNAYDEAAYENAQVIELLEGETTTISQAGNYRISGQVSEGSLLIDAEDQVVTLFLDGVSIHHSDGAAINIVDAEKVTLSLVDGTENVLEDGDNYVLNEDEEPSATVFSKADLVINGQGTLKVIGHYNDGIQSKDSLVIDGSDIQVESVDDGIIGKDSLVLYNANLVINAEGDGLKSSNDESSQVGYILLVQSEATLNTGDEGIQATSWIQVNSGVYNVTSVGDSLSADQGIIVNDGDLTLSSEDDALHSEKELIINEGQITITQSYEGIEGQKIEINGGQINLKSSDDGINAASDSNDNTLTITGGQITVDAEGDGLDANGSIYQSGGSVKIYGPRSSGNGAIDYDREYLITGGQLLASGSAGMAMLPSSSSEQMAFMIKADTTLAASTSLKIVDDEGTLVMESLLEKASETIVVSSPQLKSDTLYRVTLDETTFEFTLSDNLMAVNLEGETVDSQSGRFGGFGGPMGGRPQEGQDFDGQIPEGQAPDGERPKGERPQWPQGDQADTATGATESGEGQ